MKRNNTIGIMLLCGVFLIHQQTSAQKISVGGRGGLSVLSSATGLQLGPTIDVTFSKGMLLGSDFTINTQGGTPIEWANYVKYMIDIQQPKITPYVDGGFGLWFMTGGPYFGLRFGGGAYFQISKDISIPADIQLGPVFTSGSSSFYLAMTSGIRYNLP
jgi:hypothetical protein